MSLDRQALDNLEEKWKRPPVFRIVKTDDAYLYLAKSRKDFELAASAHEDVRALLSFLRNLLDGQG